MKSLSALLLVAGLAGCATHVGQPETQAQPLAGDHDYEVRRDQLYTPKQWPDREQGDVYVPEGAGPYPGIIMVHGGGWDARTRKDMAGISKKLARRGYVVFNIDYRLAPRARYPAALEDTRAAIRWMRAHAAELKLDAARIGGWGYSAGAHLVLLAALKDAAPEERLQAVVGGGTPSDFSRYPKSPIISKFIGGTSAEKPEAWKDASPITHLDAKDPPVFLYHGSWDKLVYYEDSVAMHAALQKVGVPAEFYTVRWMGHVMTFLLGGGAEGAGMDFLDRYLRRQAG